MERVLGIGGYFMRAADPVALGAWYRDCLGLEADENGLWRQGAGETVFTDTVKTGVAYEYAVQAIDKAGNIGPMSNHQKDTAR